MADINDIPELYAVRNKEGKWFRARGLGGSGKSWVDDVRKARIYSRIGPARATVSFFINKHPQYGIPDLVKFNISGFTVLNEKDRIEEQNIKKRKREAQHAKRVAEYYIKTIKYNVEEAEKRLKEEAEKRLKKAEKDLENISNESKD